MVSTAVEGGIILAKTLREPAVLPQQVLLRALLPQAPVRPGLMPARQPILCAGAAHWDVIGRTAAPLPHGADVPGRVERRPGGVALNIALALAGLGHPVALLAAIGRDPAGDALAAPTSRRPASRPPASAATPAPPTPTSRSRTWPASSTPPSPTAPASRRPEPALLAPLADGRLAAPWPGRVVADGNLPAPVLAALLDHPATAAAPVAIVPASPAKAARARAALRRPTGRRSTSTAPRPRRSAAPPSPTAAPPPPRLRARGVAEAVVTDGAAAVTVADAGGVLTLAPPPVVARCVTGAGDAFVAAHLAARADGLAPEPALAAALAASARHIACEVP